MKPAVALCSSATKQVHEKRPRIHWVVQEASRGLPVCRVPPPVPPTGAEEGGLSLLLKPKRKEPPRENSPGECDMGSLKFEQPAVSHLKRTFSKKTFCQDEAPTAGKGWRYFVANRTWAADGCKELVNSQPEDNRHQGTVVSRKGALAGTPKSPRLHPEGLSVPQLPSNPINHSGGALQFSPRMR